MFKHLNFRILCGIVIIGVILIAGTYFFSQRSYKRFKAEIGETPQVNTSSENVSENGVITQVKQPNPSWSTESAKENINVESQSITESETASVTEEGEISTEKTGRTESPSDFDASSLLSTFGIPEEVTALLDNDAETEDFEKAETQLTEKYGQSPEVVAIIEKLKQMSGGPVELKDITELFEAWIRVLPEEQQDTRRRLMSVLIQLNQAKELGGDPPAIISIEISETNGKAE